MNYIYGNLFKDYCKYSVGHYVDRYTHHFRFKISSNDNNYYFVKTEYLELFFNNFKIDEPFYLVTHNSDINIDFKFASILDHPNLICWYGQNINMKHPKLKSIPIGLANPKWEHGNQEVFKLIQDQNFKKTNLVYCNYALNTNFTERSLCKELTEVEPCSPKPYKEYLEDMAKSYFCISPNGNGIDCHKHWEALYLKTIPIVSNSINIQNFVNMGIPFLVLDDWKDYKSWFSSNKESIQNVYKDTWGNFDVSTLNIEKFLKI